MGKKNNSRVSQELLDADYLGLAHYRRHFSIKKNNNDKKGWVLTGEQLETILADTDVVLPKPRNYFIETNYSQCVHAHQPRRNGHL